MENFSLALLLILVAMDIIITNGYLTNLYITPHHTAMWGWIYEAIAAITIITAFAWLYLQYTT